jgi:hypothetical protein
MKRLLLAAVLTLALVLSLAGTAAAQTQQYRTEVCINASNAAEAKRLFPNAVFHIIPDQLNSDMNGWRIVTGAGDKLMSDQEEISLRQQQHDRELVGE